MTIRQLIEGKQTKIKDKLFNHQNVKRMLDVASFRGDKTTPLTREHVVIGINLLSFVLMKLEDYINSYSSTLEEGDRKTLSDWLDPLVALFDSAYSLLLSCKVDDIINQREDKLRPTKDVFMDFYTLLLVYDSKIGITKLCHHFDTEIDKYISKVGTEFVVRPLARLTGKLIEVLNND